MHDLEQLRNQLHQILKAKVEWVHLQNAPFDFVSHKEERPPSEWDKDGVVYYPVIKQGTGWNCFAIEEVELSRSERELISLMISRSNYFLGDTSPEESTDFRLHQIRDWIVRGEQGSQPPNHLADLIRLYSNKEQIVPFLLIAKSGPSIHMTYQEGEPFFRSYFERETVLIPMSEQEWLLLVDGELIHEAGDEELEPMIEAMGAALYEVILAEMAEPLTIIAHPPTSWTSLPAVYKEQQLSRSLASDYASRIQVITPRKLLVEHLLHSAGTDVIERWKTISPALFISIADPEIVQTLEAFFDNDGKLSETAKALYIHRNTLLYRLDRFKQDTGWDVRVFSQAMVVRISMLMQHTCTK